MMTSDRARHRIQRRSSATIGPRRGDRPSHQGESLRADATVDCGWGRMIFAHTFRDNEALARTICDEVEGRRNLALYVQDPHVVVSLAPQELFLDPSHTYRLWLSTYRPARVLPEGFVIRRLQTSRDAEDIHRLLTTRGMVSADPELIWSHRRSRKLTYLVAEDAETGSVIGTVTGIDHAEAFGDPENGSSMWCLAVDPQASQPGIGRALVAHIADHFLARGRSYMDLSVMHDNTAVIRLYEDMGFERVPVFCIKKRNAINEPLFMGPRPETRLNPYAQIITHEALRRGIGVDVLDAENGYFALHLGGRRIVCRESLSELTSAIAMSRCENKRVTHRVLSAAGLRVPRQQQAGEAAPNEAFLGQCGRLVVKPAVGEQGLGISVNVSTADELDQAITLALRYCPEVILEEYVSGDDLRIVVIGHRVVAAAVRRPAAIVGTGRHSVARLIDKQSRRRAAATGGESRIPVDEETRRCLRRQGRSLEDIPGKGEAVQVRETANLHTGGTLHDVTAQLSPVLTKVACQASRALDIPVVGLDLIVADPAGEDYVLIEANERPGLANHEPQPTAERFIDLLFPQTAGSS
ncbi:MAG: N-acetylglutaminylglutamine synthetase [Chromatiales bacterium]|nr:N-acetylglutaminylglutamine synthetase [Chromatiales bacterium]